MNVNSIKLQESVSLTALTLILCDNEVVLLQSKEAERICGCNYVFLILLFYYHKFTVFLCRDNSYFLMITD